MSPRQRKFPPFIDVNFLVPRTVCCSRVPDGTIVTTVREEGVELIWPPFLPFRSSVFCSGETKGLFSEPFSSPRLPEFPGLLPAAGCSQAPDPFRPFRFSSGPLSGSSRAKSEGSATPPFRRDARATFGFCSVPRLLQGPVMTESVFSFPCSRPPIITVSVSDPDSALLFVSVPRSRPPRAAWRRAPVLFSDSSPFPFPPLFVEPLTYCPGETPSFPRLPAVGRAPRDPLVTFFSREGGAWSF